MGWKDLLNKGKQLAEQGVAKAKEKIDEKLTPEVIEDAQKKAAATVIVAAEKAGQAVRAADEATKDLREKAGNALGSATDALGKAWNGTGAKADGEKPKSLAEKILGNPNKPPPPADKPK